MKYWELENLLMDIFFWIAVPIISSIIVWFLLALMVPLERKDIAGRLRGRDFLISLGTIFVAVHLLFHMLLRPSWKDVVAFYLRRKGSFLVQISLWTMVIFYISGIYTVIRWICAYAQTKRGFYYTALGIFIFALLMAAIMVISLVGAT